MNRIQSVPVLVLALGVGLSRAQTLPAPEIRAITGRPFTADATTVRTQTLGDGNRVIHTITSLLARDTEGRTRLEETIAVFRSAALARDSKKVIFITDPVASTNYVLEANHTARRIAMAADSGTHSSSDTERKIFPSSKIESLGSEVIEGLRAEGTRTTEVIPAGQVGNERPLEITYERWYSPELQTIIMSRRDDPRTGETVYRVSHIQRVEPPASLFEVPPDYKVEDFPASVP